jgi:Zn-dependent peptidase ImmA (M78 family)
MSSFHILTWDTMPPEHVEESSERSRNRVEQLANNFASAVLMPTAALYPFGSISADVVAWLNATADALAVTSTALKWRLVALERLEFALAREIPDTALRNYGRKAADDHPPPLFSKSFVEIVALAIKEGQISVRRAADVLDLTLDGGRASIQER